jgi:hypothetical protein
MKYRFEILHTPKSHRDIVKLMKSWDLDIQNVGMRDAMVFTASKELSIAEIKNHIIEAYKSEDSEVISIEGGMIE